MNIDEVRELVLNVRRECGRPLSHLVNSYEVALVEAAVGVGANACMVACTRIGGHASKDTCCSITADQCADACGAVK